MEDIEDVEFVSTRTPEQPTELAKSSSVLAPSAKFDNLENTIKVLLSHVYFGSSTKEKCMMAKTFTDMGLLFRPSSRQVSICFRRMRDEVVIPFSEVLNCELHSERELVVKLKTGFTRAYYSHPDAFPYKKEPVLMNNDPTNGDFSRVSSLLIRSYHATDFDFLSEHGFNIKSENFNKKKTNEVNGEYPIASTSSSNDKNSTSLSNDKKSTSSFNDKKSTIQQPSEDNSIKASSSSQQGTSPKVMMDYVTVTQKIVSKTKTVTKSFGSRQDSNDQQNRLNNYTSQRSQPLQYSLRSPSSSTSTFNSSQITSLPKFSTMTSSTLNSRNNNNNNNNNNNSSAQSSKFTRNISTTFTPQNEVNLQNSRSKSKAELYITCVFASEKRAFIYSIDGTLFHLHFAIRQRFKKQVWKNTWFKSNVGESWYPLKEEEDWRIAKLSRNIIKGYIRIEIYFR